MLTHPPTALPQVGKAKAKLAAKLGIHSVRDVLFSYPRLYKDFSRVLSPDEAELGEAGLFFGTLFDLNERSLSKNRRLIQARLVGKKQVLTLSWFTVPYHRGQSYQYRQLAKANQIWVYGEVKDGYQGLEIAGGEFFTRKPQHQSLVPVYPLVSGITNRMRLAWIEFALQYLDQIEEFLPPHLLERFIDRREALAMIHFPLDHQTLARARERLVFEEFFLFHTSLGVTNQDSKYVVHPRDGELTETFLANLPFELTAGQEKAIADVRADMEASLKMNRLIQGDVGSGKTVIAQYAALKAVDGGGQVAFMVPTEILADQMYERVNAAFAPLGVEVKLLVGKTSPKERRDTLAQLAAGKLPVVVGTHALISDDVLFHNLTLAIVDEQHRFGVKQRLALRKKSDADLIVMSATPIPRSLALTIYGDMNTSIMRDLPHGRRPVDTRLIRPQQRDDVYRFVVQRVKQGEQAFVVFPLVEESEKLDLRSAIQEMELLSQNQLASVRVGLVHGKMGKAKEQVMEDFYNQKLDVLISTTVIEVGMNVLTATVMVIEEADRFGLAQLHQLRGRVGRAQAQGYCFLIADPKTDIARERLDIIRHSNDGLAIAEADLRIRGPGDLLGTRQSGEPWFKLADLVEDQDLLVLSAQESRKLILANPTLNEYPALLKEIKRQQPY